VFFFSSRRRHTRLQGDWSSDVCSSDLQMKLIPEFLAGIDCLLRRAEELQIREKLVVVVQSEMGRTPNYNNGNGKDHWSIGSMMRSEERRVGKGCRSRGWVAQEKKEE